MRFEECWVEKGGADPTMEPLSATALALACSRVWGWGAKCEALSARLSAKPLTGWLADNALPPSPF